MLKSPSPPQASPEPSHEPTTFPKFPPRHRTKERFLLYGAWAILVLSLVAMVAAGSSIDRSTSTPEPVSSESSSQP